MYCIIFHVCIDNFSRQAIGDFLNMGKPKSGKFLQINLYLLGMFFLEQENQERGALPYAQKVFISTNFCYVH